MLRFFRFVQAESAAGSAINIYRIGHRISHPLLAVSQARLLTTKRVFNTER